ncbi:MAG: hypothetical protein WC091_01115 [Sulfuricellaceae bacterium]
MREVKPPKTESEAKCAGRCHLAYTQRALSQLANLLVIIKRSQLRARKQQAWQHAWQALPIK